jgi:acetylornithine deacetylase/succinyl-diaminopimelate desuccinylase-like protein
MGREAVITPSMAGAAPMWEVCHAGDIPNVTLGAGRADCMAHAPDENYRIDDALTAARILARFLDRFAATGLTPRA